MFEIVDISGSTPAYVQIMNQVRFAVASGRLKTGDRLPPLHELGPRIGVHYNTVVKAYRDLRAMGVIVSRSGKGYFINKGVEAKCRSECRARVLARFNEVVAEARAAGMPHRQIKAICSASYASDAAIYGKAPKEIVALAKR